MVLFPRRDRRQVLPAVFLVLGMLVGHARADDEGDSFVNNLLTPPHLTAASRDDGLSDTATQTAAPNISPEVPVSQLQNAAGYAAIHMAAEHGNVEAVDILIEAGDPGSKDSVWRDATQASRTLHASQGGRKTPRPPADATPPARRGIHTSRASAPGRRPRGTWKRVPPWQNTLTRHSARPRGVGNMRAMLTGTVGLASRYYDPLFSRFWLRMHHERETVWHDVKEVKELLSRTLLLLSRPQPTFGPLFNEPQQLSHSPANQAKATYNMLGL